MGGAYGDDACVGCADGANGAADVSVGADDVVASVGADDVVARVGADEVAAMVGADDVAARVGADDDDVALRVAADPADVIAGFDVDVDVDVVAADVVAPSFDGEIGAPSPSGE